MDNYVGVKIAVILSSHILLAKIQMIFSSRFPEIIKKEVD
jgi:hypothetical protein